MLDLVDVQLQFGEVLSQLCVILLGFDGIFVVFNCVLVVMVVDECFANFADQLAVDFVAHAVLCFLLVDYCLVRFAYFHECISDQDQVGDGPVLLHDVEETQLVQPAVFDVSQLHVRQSLLRLYPDRRCLVNVFEDVDCLFYFAE